MRSLQSDASGFVMVVLLIVMGIGAVWMAASLPAWKQQATREKEAELVFRGRQYVRALSLWERKNGPGTRPANIDMMVDNKVLRRKYKDPRKSIEERYPSFSEYRISFFRECQKLVDSRYLLEEDLSHLIESRARFRSLFPKGQD